MTHTPSLTHYPHTHHTSDSLSDSGLITPHTYTWQLLTMTLPLMTIDLPEPHASLDPSTADALEWVYVIAVSSTARPRPPPKVHVAYPGRRLSFYLPCP